MDVSRLPLLPVGHVAREGTHRRVADALTPTCLQLPQVVAVGGEGYDGLVGDRLTARPSVDFIREGRKKKETGKPRREM